MNQKIVTGLVALIVIVGGIAVYASNSSKQAMMQKEKDKAAQEAEVMKKEETMKKGTDVMVKNDTAMMAKAGTYESYDASKIAMASATHTVVLFFRASWCPTCIAVDKDIRANLKAIPASLTILDVNYDDSTELKKKYGVTYQHTFVQVDAQGNLIKKWSGSPTLASLVAQIK